MNSPQSTTTHNPLLRRGALDPADVVLTEDDAALIAAAAESAHAQSTRQTYASLWRRFEAWCRSRQYDALPAAPVAVAAYLVLRAKTAAPATVGLDAAAIGHYHRRRGLPNPTADNGVKIVLAGLARANHAGNQKQARPISRGDLAAIKATATRPRRGRGGRPESWQTARARGLQDYALCCLMWDGMLRRSETADLKWSDIRRAEDGSGRLTVRHSKTDQRGEGKVLWISPATMSALAIYAARRRDGDPDWIFDLSPPQISNRIAAACAAAGLGSGYTGHSLRVGAAQALAAANISLAAIMEHGRWQSARMPARYTRNAAAAQSGMAQLYAKGE